MEPSNCHDADRAVRLSSADPPAGSGGRCAHAPRERLLCLAVRSSPNSSAATRSHGRPVFRLIEKHAGGSAYQIAETYALRNDSDHAFEWLDRAWSNRDPGIAGLLYDPLILRYKVDPRFNAFCRKIGLPPPGTAAGAVAG